MNQLDALTALPSREEQTQLYALLARQSRRYTQGDHGSLPIEIAEGLLASIRYTLRHAPQDAQESLSGRFQAGRQVLDHALRHAKSLLVRVQASALPVRNLSYLDTLAALPLFFRAYDPDFFAHETPVDIDYQLCHALPECTGVDYMTAYLQALLIENRFLCRFPIEEVRRVLTASCPDDEGLLINLYLPVLQNALGRQLLGLDPRPLALDADAVDACARRLLPLAPQALTQALARAAEQLFHALSIDRAEDQAYALRACDSLVPRLLVALAQGDVSGFFYAPRVRQMEGAHFADGRRMPEHALRALVDALRQGQGSVEKAALVRARVHSLRDLGDVLSAGFWGEEPLAVFALLTPCEQKALREMFFGAAPEWMPLLIRWMEEDHPAAEDPFGKDPRPVV